MPFGRTKLTEEPFNDSPVQLPRQLQVVGFRRPAAFPPSVTPRPAAGSLVGIVVTIESKIEMKA